MFYYSDYTQPCVKDASHQEWCNVPNKVCFNPTEQMIVAYHKGTIVCAYKGYINCNINCQWTTEGILHGAEKVTDKCTRNNKAVAPAPFLHGTGIFGLNFDKLTPNEYHKQL